MAKYFVIFFVFLLVDDFSLAGVTELSHPPDEHELEILESDVPEVSQSNDVVATHGSLTEEMSFLKGNENTNDSEIPEAVAPWNSESSPILRAITDFLHQARDGLLDPSIIAPVGSEKITEEHVVDSTTVARQDQDLEPIVDETQKGSAINLVKLQKNSDMNSAQDLNFNSVVSKRQGVVNVAANTTATCSHCYERLHACVQKCFTEHNCHNVQRDAKRCPPTPSRLCNPFLPWSPVDECSQHSDCKSPLLCCNDGCITKCSPGIWKS